MSKPTEDLGGGVRIIDKELDLSNSGRAVWLVKIPKYMSSKWEQGMTNKFQLTRIIYLILTSFFSKAEGNMEVGKLKISKIPGQKPQVSLTLSDDVLALGEEKIPKNHRLDVSVVTRQTLGVFSHMIPNNKEDEVVPESEKLFMEGRIVQKLECRPFADKMYMDMKSESIRKACVPKQQVQSLEKVVTNFKPISDHKHNIEYNNKKKNEGKKSRVDKSQVLDMLFNAFEKHQYYNIKDLVKFTNQPISYLKEILKEVCEYNMKNPHKNMWELKKEYRHYKVTKEEGDGEAGGTAAGNNSDSDD
ncbi:unnamed protein product [Diamesa tonsa]